MKKSKLNVIIIVSVIAVLGIVIGIKEFTGKKNTQPENTFETRQENQANLYAKFQKIKNAKKIGLIVISYEGQCCPSTKAFLEKYNKQANRIIEKFKKQTNALFIDVGQLNNEEKAELAKLAAEIGATRLPSLAILTKNGKIHQLITGPFEMNNVGIIIWKLTQSS